MSGLIMKNFKKLLLFNYVYFIQLTRLAILYLYLLIFP